MAKESIRSCVICRKTAPKKDLMRFVEREGSIYWDKDFKRPGRGCYVHPKVECWSAMAQESYWRKAFAVKGPIDKQCLKELKMEIGAHIEGADDFNSSEKNGGIRMRL